MKHFARLHSLVTIFCLLFSFSVHANELFESIRAHDFEKVKSLITSGAFDIDFTDDKYKWTPLHVSLYSEETTEISEWLIKSGADVHTRESTGQTPLHFAVRKEGPEHQMIIELLIASEADIDARDRRQATPLLVAVEYNNTNAAELLIDNSADTNAQDIQGFGALHIASRYGYSDLINPLVISGARFDLKTLAQETPIALARKAGHTDIVTLLKNLKRHRERTNIVNSGYIWK